MLSVSLNLSFKSSREKITSSKQIDQLDGYQLTSTFSKKLQGRLQTIDDTHEWIMLFEGRAREKAKAYLIELTDKLRVVKTTA